MNYGETLEAKINGVKADYKNAVKSFDDMSCLFKSGLDFTETDNLKKLIASCRLCHESLFGAFETIMKILTDELEEPPVGKAFPTLISLSKKLHQISVGLKPGAICPGMTIDYSAIKKIELDLIVSTKDVRNDLTHKGVIREARHYESLFGNLKRLIKMVAPDFNDIVPSSVRKLEKETFGHFLSCVRFNDGWTPPAHILIMDPIWSIPDEHITLLLSLPWDIIIDLDGRGIGSWEYEHGCKTQFNLAHPSRVQQIIESNSRKTIPIFAIRPNADNYSMIRNHERTPYLNYSDGDISLNRDLECGIDALNIQLQKARRQHGNPEKAQANLDEKRRKTEVIYRFIKEYLSNYDSAVIVSLAEAFKQNNNAQQIIYEIVKKMDMNVQVVLVQDSLVEGVSLPAWIDESMCMTWDCELSTFFSEIYKNRSMFAGLISNEEKMNKKDGYRFILRDKLEKFIPRNGIINEVEDYFELLHLDVGTELSKDGEKLFYQGHPAEWSALNNNCDAHIAPETRDKIIHRIRSSFTTDPEVENTYFILHEPGVGATTLGRRIAWDIHKDFPVAILKRFDGKLLNNRINSLYRALENTPFLILADSAHGVSDDEIDEFVKLMKHQDLPIVALVVQRKHSNSRTGKNVYYFPGLNSASIEDIKKRCMKCALPLYDSQEEMNIHVNELDEYIDKRHQTPMIINMYIMDKNFKTPESYVRSFIDKDTLTENVINVLTYVSLYSLYTDHELSIRFISSVYNADGALRESRVFHTVMQSYNKLLLFRSSTKVGPPESVRCIHPLFAEEILRWLKGDSWEHSLAEMSTDFVDSAMAILTDKSTTESVSWLFARKSRNYAEETSGKMTKLVETVINATLRSAGIELLEKVATRVAGYINENEAHIDEDKTTDYSHILNLSARLWAQCARYYRNSDSYDEAMMDKYTSLSLKALDKDNPVAQRGFQDLYHMAGMCWSKKLSNLLENAPDDVSDENIANIKRTFDTTIDYYGKCVQLGNLDYGLPSIMAVYALVVKYVFNMLGFLNSDYRPEKLDDVKFSWVQQDVIDAANRLIDDAEQYDLSDEATSLLNKHANNFRYSYMLEDSDKLLQDLNNYIDRLKTNNQANPVSLQQAYSQRVYYVLNQYYDKTTKTYDYLSLYENKNDLDKVRSSIDSALEYYGRKQNYLYKIWFKLAKLDDVPFAKAKQKALDWAALINSQKKSSRYRREIGPYYYLYVISLLSKQPAEHVKKDWELLQKNNDVDDMNRNEEWILDYYASEKNGMGCLVDRDWAPHDGIRDNAMVSWVKGRIVYISANEIVGGIDADKNIVDLSKKQHKSEGQVFFKPRTADKTINQNGEEVRFKFGFTLTRLRAVDNTIADKKPREREKSDNTGPATAAAVPSNWVRFMAEWIVKSRQDQTPLLLVGKVDGQKAALHIRDIQKYAASELAPFGGAQNVLIRLKETRAFYVIIEEEREQGLNLSLHATGQMLSKVIK